VTAINAAKRQRKLADNFMIWMVGCYDANIMGRIFDEGEGVLERFK
jgi:hypothetical protein